MLPRRTPTRRAVLAHAAVVVAILGVSLGVGTPSASAQGDQSPLWTLPTSGDLLAPFSRNAYNEQDGAPQQVDDPHAPGHPSLQFTLDGGDQRSELQPTTPYLKEGDVRYYAYRAYLDPDFPTDVHTWQLILQWHQDGDSGSPPEAIEVRDNRLQLSLEGQDYKDLGPASGGQEVDLVVRIAFSQDSDKGTIDVWNDGRHVLQGFRPANGTLIDDGAYAKVGLYRDKAIDQKGRLYLEDLRIGSSLQSVRDAGDPALPTDESAGTSGLSRSARHTPLTWLAAGLVAVVASVTALRLRASR